ncbi:MAG: M36 family metallopeptidase, partial [Nannocystaceae bacterium]
GADLDHPDPSIPGLGLSNNAGMAIRAALPQAAHMYREYRVERDGTIDNQIVAHELGHYIQRRLLVSGNVATRAMGEGWGDFIALHMSLREGDDLDGVYPFPHYGAVFSDPTGYYGYRRVPYSTDTSKDALSFRHISDGEQLPDSHPIEVNGAPNAEVHNAGEVWASMMWDAYIALQKSYEGKKSFDDARRALTDYSVAGMILAPAMPTYTEQRDAILAAIAASEPEDYLPVAAAFAGRGAGTCAVSPLRESTDLIGVVEDFELSARGQITEASLSDAAVSCDDDGHLDVGEQGELKITVFNAGAAALLAGATVEVVDPDPSLVFPEGLSRTLPEVAAPTTHIVTLPVTLQNDLASFQTLDLNLRLTMPNGCEEMFEQRLNTTLHADVAANSSAVDDVEPPLTSWVIGGTEGETVWARELGTSYFWHGVDSIGVHDTWLESPVLEVSEDAPLTLAFDHIYSFDFTDPTLSDGGVIEVSTDNGMTWEDISAYADPDYPGMIDSDTNPLHMRPAFGGNNPSFPSADSVQLNLGTALAGTELKVRFRIATDSGGGAPGWFIDNIAFTGIVNTPFATWVTDAGDCVEATDSNTGTDSDTTAGPGMTETAGSETDPGTDSGGVDTDEGCGCQTSTPGLPAGLMLFGLLFVRRRASKSS